MKISLIVAMANDNAIGYNGRMPWHIPEDLQYFKKKTIGKPIIMGKNTFISINEKPLPERINIVLTRNTTWKNSAILIANSIDDALNIAKQASCDEIMIIGGAQIYRQTINLVDRIYLTRIFNSYQADQFFPKYSLENWLTINSKSHQFTHNQQTIDYQHLLLEKKINSRV